MKVDKSTDEWKGKSVRVPSMKRKVAKSTENEKESRQEYRTMNSEQRLVTKVVKVSNSTDEGIKDDDESRINKVTINVDLRLERSP